MARDPADDEVTSGVRRIPRADPVLPPREPRLAHRGPPQRFGMAFVQGDNFEKTIEKQGPPHAPEDRDPDSVRRRIERRVRLECLAVDADLERLELDRHATERRYVPVSQRLDREGGRGVARRTAFAWHR